MIDDMMSHADTTNTPTCAYPHSRCEICGATICHVPVQPGVDREDLMCAGSEPDSCTKGLCNQCN
jgi:hypothetical protein